jgi:hypothetical protein
VTLFAEITKNVEGDFAAMAAFHQAIAGSLRLPTLGLALGERVQIEAVEFGHLRDIPGVLSGTGRFANTERRGSCERLDGARSDGEALLAQLGVAHASRCRRKYLRASPITFDRGCSLRR